ncbi:penicillin-binding protein PBP1B [Streptococcus merionis]|uniref:Penicillin-binding protein 1B n=1 Tax=Streptococcus merionis TaxID=400065 RepID=A0A239T0S5_9STRE|nr:penicillin-binding protein PBP1B [Streptococcus merionis]SNU91186.1 penicillin-binding protein 1B [Streptococcus merionis]
MAKFDFEKLKNIQNNEKVKSFTSGVTSFWKKSGLAKVSPVLVKILGGIKVAFNSVFVIGLLLVSLGAGAALGYIGSLFEEVEKMNQATLVKRVSEVTGVSKLTYADGSLISEVKSDLLRQEVPSEQISSYLKQAVIATEDENFESHQGVVPKAIFRAALGSLGLGSSSGGSTLTQQLIKQQVVGNELTYSRKATEIIHALELERNLTKDEILTLYLNVSSFGRNHHGQNIAGVEEAAQGIFGVSAAELSIPQAAFIAGLPQSPIVYSPYASDGTLKSAEGLVYGLGRAHDVLYNMYRTGALTKEEFDIYSAYDITQDFLPGEPIVSDSGDYLYYAVMEEAESIVYDLLIQRDQVSEEKLQQAETVQTYKEMASRELSLGGYTVSTTINPAVYQAMQQAANAYSGVLQDGTSTVEVGNILLNNKTGAVIGFVGGYNYASNQVNHALNTYRSPGSNIKPILPYAIAIDQGLMGSASMVSNYPATYASGQKIMHGVSAGTKMETLQEALNQSQNIPAYWTYKLLRDSGINVQSYMEKMNISIPEYGIESLPLGSGAEVTVAQMANAYQTIANDGVYQKYHMVDKITDESGEVIYQHQSEPVQVFSKAAATIMQQLLRGPITSGATTYYLNQLRGQNGTLAGADWIGKTGSTDYYKDVWLSLATPTVTLSGWAGHDDNTAMPDDTGYNRNAQYMARLVAAIYAADPGVFGNIGERFELDSSVIASQVLTATGQRPGQVTINGRTFTVGGETTTSYWAKNGAPVTGYRFAIGGTDADYARAWGSIGGNSEQKDDEEEKDNKESEETSSSSRNDRTESSEESSSSRSSSSDSAEEEAEE